MKLTITPTAAAKGFAFAPACEADYPEYLNIKREGFRKYVDEYYGGWVEDVQIKMNHDVFMKTLKQSCFVKVLLGGETVGFFGCDEQEDAIAGITLQLTAAAQNQGLGSSFLSYVTGLARQTGKPASLKVFKSNPAQGLYARFGFEPCGETFSHILMRYDPEIRS